MGVPENESNLSSGQGTENPLVDTAALDTFVEEVIWVKLFGSFFCYFSCTGLSRSWDLASIMLGLMQLNPCFSFSLRG